MMEKAVRFLHKEPTIWGPISLLCTVAIGVKTAIPFDLLLLAAAGLFLSARLQFRGCCYSLALLGITAAFKHAFLTTDHLWQLGIEGSLGCAFFITAIAFEQGANWIESLQSQMQTRVAALENLEEELAKVQQTGAEQQIAFQEKVATLQKELEEIQADHSSILILNEVLRKTTAKHIQENAQLTENVLDLRRQKEILKTECLAIQQDLDRAKGEGLSLQNGELMKELNAARYEKEQTHLINETLARLYARENMKAKEANEEAASFADQLGAARAEAMRIAKLIEEQVSVKEVQDERDFLKDQLQTALTEVAQLKSAPRQDPEMAEQLAFAQQKVYQLSAIEPLFRQLKAQFDEKTQVLHQVRSELFKSDTELQRLRMEKGALELNPLPKEVERELNALSSQLAAVEEENQELQDLITVLTNDSDAAKRKKKLKMKLSPEQEFLF